MAVSAEKEQALRERMARLGVTEKDLQETFIRSSGPGGQKVNKTSSCVQLVHLPTGISVKCQRERSQTLNRFLARRILLDQLEGVKGGMKVSDMADKIRRNKDRRLRRGRTKSIPADPAAQADP
ncbi:MAG: peptide chain release factor-like protein [Smithellaceae bacterium]|nr:peptide chain release factor-like protein [Smithellaceae bacterium]